MKRTIKSMIAGAALCFTLAAPVFAQTQSQPVNVRNAGSWKCAQFVEIISQTGREVEKTAFLQWTAAYATAAARSNSLIDVFPIVDTWEMVVMVGMVCRENPDATFETAIRVAIARLRPFWVKSNGEVLTLNDPGGRKVQYYKEAVAPLQGGLNRYGAGLTVDGGYGDKTGNAIRQLNQNRGANAWMTPSGEFLYQLTRPAQN